MDLDPKNRCHLAAARIGDAIRARKSAEANVLKHGPRHFQKYVDSNVEREQFYRELLVFWRARL